MEKICKECKQPKSFDQFYKKKDGKFGIQTNCKICVDSKNKLDYLKNKDSILLKNKENYLKKDKSLLKVKRREGYLRNKKKILEEKKEYYKKNRDKILAKNALNKDKKAEYTKRYNKEKPEKSRIRESEKRLIKKKSSLLICKKLGKKQIEDFYKDAIMLEKIFGEKFEVDHIIPIKHKLVCGLHVPWNLQILTCSDNRKKLNRFDGTYENESWRLDYV